MPCFDPTLYMTVDIDIKILIADHEALKLALYDLSNRYKSFFYEKIEDGFMVRCNNGALKLSWDGQKYTIRGNQSSQTAALSSAIIQQYQSVNIQNTLVEKGYTTEQTTVGNTIQLVARRV